MATYVYLADFTNSSYKFYPDFSSLVNIFSQIVQPACVLLYCINSVIIYMMFRWILRSLLISYAAIYAAQSIVGGFDVGGTGSQTFFLLIIAISLLNMFIIPIFKVLGLPDEGISFIFLSFVLTLVIIYILPMFMPGFTITSTELAELRIFGFVLPSKHLTVSWSAVYSALVISLVYHFAEWLCDKR